MFKKMQILITVLIIFFHSVQPVIAGPSTGPTLTFTVSGTSCTLYWTNYGYYGATVYVIARYTSIDGNWEHYSDYKSYYIYNGYTYTFTDFDLSPGIYCYIVEPLTSSGNLVGGSSNFVNVCIQVPSESPTLRGAVNASSTSLSWTSSTGATSYIIERSSNGSNFIQIGTASGTSYTDLGTSGGTYYYRVIPVNSYGNGPYSNILSVTIQQTPPAIPTGLSGSATSTQVQLTWNLNTETNLAGYYIFRNGVQIAQVGKTTFYTDTGLEPNTTYSYSIEAYNTSSLNSNMSNMVTITTTSPSAPSGLAISNISSTGATASWNQVDGAESYNIYLDGSPVYNTTQTHYEITGLTSGTNHTIEVRTVIIGVESGSVTINFTTDSMGQPPQQNQGGLLFTLDMSPVYKQFTNIFVSLSPLLWIYIGVVLALFVFGGIIVALKNR